MCLLSNMKKYITTPIYYVNGSPHIGHAYTSLACDIFTRFQKLADNDVFFLTGTDEHGQKIETSAKQLGIRANDFVDQNSLQFKNLNQVIDVVPSDFVRTTEWRHKKAATALWDILFKNEMIYLSNYSGWYSIRDEAFFDESEIKDGLAPTGAPVSYITEECYFFKLSKFTEKLLAFYKKNPNFITPKSRFNEILRFVEGGLNDLCISRTTFSWGIPIPNNEKHIMYVWLDALTNYLTGIGFPDNPDFELFQSAIHVMGKEILRFHAVYWPAFLMAANIPLPKKIIAHGWWTCEGEKMSKSLGNVVDPFELCSKYGADTLRYYLFKEVSFGSDGDFSYKSLQTRRNSELADTFGNLVQRVLSFVYKYEFEFEGDVNEEFMDIDKKPFEDFIDQFAFSKYLDLAFEYIRNANAFIDIQKPWSLRKTDTDKLLKVLTILVNFIKDISVILSPFLPNATNEIFKMLGLKNQTLKSLGQRIPLKRPEFEPKPLFVKID